MPDVVRRYTDLTGKAPLPPRWALGFQQSRYSYMTDAELREVAARLRSDRIPTDVLWLDIDYQDRNRPFTVDTKAFPNLRGLATDMRRQGFKLVTITDLHVAHAPNEGYAALRQRNGRRPFPQEGGRQPVRRAGLAGAVGLSRLHPPGQPANGGAACTRTSSTTGSPASGTT